MELTLGRANELAQFRSLAVLFSTLCALSEEILKETHLIPRAGFPVKAADFVSKKGGIREMRYSASKSFVFRRNS